MKLLVFQHVVHEHPGYIADYAIDNNIDLDIVELWKPYVVPDYSGYNAVIIMGGPMGAYENYSSRDDEISFIKNNVGKIPMIGFCLGSQLIAYALGAKVYPNIQDEKKLKEVGYFDIILTEAGEQSKILDGFPGNFQALQWHGDVFEMPDRASLLAGADLCKNQAFSYKNAFGFLFHFEFTPDMIAKQIEIDKQWIHEDNELDEVDLLKQAESKAQIMKSQCYRLLDNFLKI